MPRKLGIAVVDNAARSIGAMALLLVLSLAACGKPGDGGMGPGDGSGDDGGDDGGTDDGGDDGGGTGNPPPETVVVPAGTFQMGEVGIPGSEPVHPVTISHDLIVSATEVTHAVWTETYDWALANGYAFEDFDAHGRGAMGGQQTGAGSTHVATEPVVQVEWYDAVLWCNARSEREGRTPCYYTDAAHTLVYRSGRDDLANDEVDWEADGYRLPTEAEWEYSCRAGTTTLYYWGSGIDAASLDPNAWWHGNSGLRTQPVRGRTANAWGLYDVSGNVYEWVWDRFASTYYAQSPAADPRGPDTGNRLVRGGGFDQPYGPLRSGHRTVGLAYSESSDLGFRFVRRAP
jgi:formylglycine-generating enzyme required for sulfatase activity